MHWCEGAEGEKNCMTTDRREWVPGRLFPVPVQYDAVLISAKFNIQLSKVTAVHRPRDEVDPAVRASEPPERAEIGPGLVVHPQPQDFETSWLYCGSLHIS